jgi:hypothetical protein
MTQTFAGSYKNTLGRDFPAFAPPRDTAVRSRFASFSSDNAAEGGKSEEATEQPWTLVDRKRNDKGLLVPLPNGIQR